MSVCLAKPGLNKTLNMIGAGHYQCTNGLGPEHLQQALKKPGYNCSKM